MGNTAKKLVKKDPSQGDDLGIDTKSIKRIVKKGSITKYYKIYDIVLGRGHYATVNLAVNRKTGEKVAVKRIHIRKSRLESLQREVDILLQVGDHPNIVKLFDIFITDSEVQLVMELLSGGELFDRMVESGPYSEHEASDQICKIAHALKFLHSRNVVHRDLKPENLILHHKGPAAELKMADFGLSKFVDDVQNSTMKTVCGTWAYCAPEVRQSMGENGQASYTAKVDTWSAGVIMYVMLSAYHPFDPDGELSDEMLWKNICTGEYKFEDPVWDNISDAAKDLIRNLIVTDPEKRYSPQQMLDHPWIKGVNIPITPITPNIDRSLKQFRKRNFLISPVPEKKENANLAQHTQTQQHQNVGFQAQQQIQQHNEIPVQHAAQASSSTNEPNTDAISTDGTQNTITQTEPPLADQHQQQSGGYDEKIPFPGECDLKLDVGFLTPVYPTEENQSNDMEVESQAI